MGNHRPFTSSDGAKGAMNIWRHAFTSTPASGTTSTSSSVTTPTGFTYSVTTRPLDVTSGASVPPGEIIDRRITEQVRSLLPRIRDRAMAERVAGLVRATEEAAFSLKLAGRDLDSLPPARGTIDAEGSVFIEWITRDFRLGFDVEPDPLKSGWYIVSSERLGELSLQGDLSVLKPDDLIAIVVRFAQANS